MNETLKASERCLALIKQFEGLHDGDKRTPIIEAMADPVGIPTIGWGCTYHLDGRHVKFGDKLTIEQCEELLRHEIVRFENIVKKHVKVKLNQNQFDALVSFTYNLGEGNLRGSTLLKKLNENCFGCAADQFPRWIYSGGKSLPGLVTRRFQEKILFLS